MKNKANAKEDIKLLKELKSTGLVAISDDMDDQTKSFIRLLSEGYSIDKIIDIMDLEKKSVVKNKEEVVRYSLKKLAKKGYRLVGDILDNKPVEKEIVIKMKKGKKKVVKINDYPTYRDRIELIKLIYDRYEPVQKSNVINVGNLNISPVDLNRYRNEIDITPE